MPGRLCAADPKKARRGCDAAQVGASGHPVVEMLPGSCQVVDLVWTGTVGCGETAGLQAYAHITRLTLKRFRCMHA